MWRRSAGTGTEGNRSMARIQDYPELLSLLRKHEGLRLKPYRCTGGALTIGYGHNLDANGITQEDAERFLERDAQAALDCARAEVSNFDALSKARQSVLVSMVFQLGPSGFRQFRRTIELVERGDFAEAAKQMLLSRWAKQTPRRAEELARMMEQG
jgi:lysozyme